MLSIPVVLYDMLADIYASLSRLLPKALEVAPAELVVDMTSLGLQQPWSNQVERLV